MLTTADLLAGMDSLQVRLLVSACSAVFVLQVLDGRRSTSSASVLLSVTGLSLCFGAWVSLSGVYISTCLAITGVALAYQSWICLRRWAATSEREIHEEAHPLEARKAKSAPKPGKLAKSGQASERSSSVPRLTESLVCYVTVVTSSVALFLAGRSATGIGLIAYVQHMHLIAAAMAAGVALACSIELTFLASPDALRPAMGHKVKWYAIAWFALLVFLVELVASAAILVAPVDEQSDALAQLFPRVFALSLVIVNFVAWMVPQRVAGFQRAGEATQWTSLTLASWIGVLGLLVVNALPSNWPWGLLR